MGQESTAIALPGTTGGYGCNSQLASRLKCSFAPGGSRSGKGQRRGQSGMSKITAVLMVGCMAGCGTVASGSYGVPLDEHPKPGADPAPPAVPSGLRVSAGELHWLSSPYFGAVEVTFENPTPGWVEIEQVDVDFGSPQRNQAVFLPWGAYIDAWRQSVVDLLAIERATGQGLLFTPLPLPLLTVGGDEMAARDRPEGAAAARGGVISVAELRAAETAVTPTAPGGAVPGRGPWLSRRRICCRSPSGCRLACSPSAGSCCTRRTARPGDASGRWCSVTRPATENTRASRSRSRNPCPDGRTSLATTTPRRGPSEWRGQVYYLHKYSLN